MAEAKEPLRDKLTVVVVQTLIFGALLAALGFWFDRQLEAYKQVLTEETERTKVLLQSLTPHIRQRRAAYQQFRQSARTARTKLASYYYLAKGQTNDERRWTEIESLKEELGIRSGFSISGKPSWNNPREAFDVINNLWMLRNMYQEVSSKEIIADFDAFIDIAMSDLRASAQETNDTEAFHGAAKRRIREAFDSLSVQIDTALGRDQIPLQ